MSKNEIKNITPANVPQYDYDYYYDDYSDFRGLNHFMLMLIAAAMIPWFVGGYVILGFNVTGWAWVIPLIFSLFLCLRNISKITFPFAVWLLWVIWLLTYWFLGFGNLDAHQSLFQTLSPIVIGCAASIYRPDTWQMANMIRWLSRLAVLAWIILVIRVPMILTGVLPGHGFMAAEMIGLLLLGACYASFYGCGSHRHLYYYVSMIVITLVALVRGPMVAMLSCLPFTLAPLGIIKRFVMITVLLIFGAVIFNTDRVQQRMFATGSGDITEVRLNNPNLRDNARKAMWDTLMRGVIEKPFFGNGWNAHREVLLRAGFKTYAPHNDWLKLWHDIGAIGFGLYALTMFLQIFFIVRVARWATGAHQMLAYGTATAFIPYMLIMFTDNVVLYVQFFGNLHFALIGIVYGACLKRWEEENYYG